MRSAILNAARPRTLNAGPEMPWNGLPAELMQATSNPALIGTESISGSTRSESFDPETMIGWVRTGSAVQQAGNVALGGVDFGQLAAAMGTGAAAGAPIAGVGAVVGAVAGAVMYAVQFFTGGVARDWVDAAPGVHDWFTAYGPEAFLQWVRSERPELLSTNPQELTRALLLWWLERDGVVITDAPGRSHYNGIPDFVYYNMAGQYDALITLYLPLGIDYPRTRLEAHPAGTSGADGTSTGAGGVWMLDRVIMVPEGTTANPVDITELAEGNDGESEQKNGGKLLIGGSALALILSKIL